MSCSTFLSPSAYAVYICLCSLRAAGLMVRIFISGVSGFFTPEGMLPYTCHLKAMKAERKSWTRRFVRVHSICRRNLGSVKIEGRFLPVGIMNVSVASVN